jgi:hypothetical protein
MHQRGKFLGGLHCGKQDDLSAKEQAFGDCDPRCPHREHRPRGEPNVVISASALVGEAKPVIFAGNYICREAGVLLMGRAGSLGEALVALTRPLFHCHRGAGDCTPALGNPQTFGFIALGVPGPVNWNAIPGRVSS